ncbi:MAG TPA: helix-turn-helix transcriptional regulator [Thermoanaerobacterales bacterium]|nr:helix-turn-helix transcriptional regulator [Thermoanaerobacterales bacterium]
MENTGERIKQLRQEHGLTQEQFGKIVGVTKHAVSLYEASKNAPSDDIKKKIASHFNVSIDWLLGMSNIRTPVTDFSTEDLELMEFWNILQTRDDLKILVKEIQDIPPKEVKKIIQIIKTLRQ